MKTFASALPTAGLALIDTGHKSVYKAFSGLYLHHSAPVAYVRCKAAEVAAALALCEQHRVFALVLGLPETVVSSASFSAAVISPAVKADTYPFKDVLNHPALRHFTALAHQSYLTPPGDLELLKARYFECLRLGSLREDMTLSEPLLRDADYVWFDLNAIRVADAPQTRSQEPNGLYAEEACRLLHYVALSNKTKVLFIYGYNSLSAKSITARLLAQLVWHVAEGLAVRVKEELSAAPGNPTFKEIMVDMGVRGQELYFMHSTITQRWWFKIVDNKEHESWIPCSPADYQTACRGEVPLRWLWYYQKLNY